MSPNTSEAPIPLPIVSPKCTVWRATRTAAVRATGPMARGQADEDWRNARLVCLSQVGATAD